MRKSILIKYVGGELSPQEELEVLEWADRDEANGIYLARLKNIWISQHIPQGKASASEVEKIMHIIREPHLKKPVPDAGGGYRIKKWVFWSAAAVVILLFGTGIWLTDFGGGGPQKDLLANLPVLSYKNFETSKVLYTPKGVKAKLVLPDSSEVWLNSDTRIEYPDKFDSLVRSVTLSGEAYFSVVKNPDRPMIVRTSKGFSLQVLGTEFNIKAYDNDDKAQATLYSGEINLLREIGNRIVTTSVTPFQTVVIQTNVPGRNVTKVMKEHPKDEAAWKDGIIIFDSTPVSEVIKILERWHGVRFVVRDKEVLNYKITATFNSESIVQIMDLIQLTSLVNYKIDNSTVTLQKK